MKVPAAEFGLWMERFTKENKDDWGYTIRTDQDGIPYQIAFQMDDGKPHGIEPVWEIPWALGYIMRSMVRIAIDELKIKYEEDLREPFPDI